MNRIYSILFGLLICLTCFGQSTSPKIRKYSTAKGLSNSVISSVTQDNYGFIWIAESFSHFNLQKTGKFDANLIEIPANSITTLVGKYVL